MYGAGFTVGSLTRKGARGGMRGTGNKERVLMSINGKKCTERKRNM